MFGMPLVTLTKGSSSNNIYNNQLFLQQAFATRMDSATSNETTVYIKDYCISTITSD
jgi:hypothetical protein